MKPVLIACALASTALVSPSSFADVIEVDSKIDHATIYRNAGADVRRIASVNIPAGSHKIVIQNLTDAIEDFEDIRAVVKNKDVVITGIKTEEVVGENLPSPDQKPIQDEINRLNIELNNLATDKTTETLKLEFVKGVSKETSDKKDTAEEWQAKFAFISETIPSINKDIGRINREITATRLQISKLREQLKNTGAVREDAYQTTLNVYASEAVSTDVELQYYVDDSSWEATLDAKLNSEAKTIDLSLIGQITQDSGEDWISTSLSLSSTRPDADSLDDISSQFLSIYEPRPVPIIVQDKRQRANTPLPNSYARGDFEDGVVEEVVVTGSAIRTRFDTSFDMPGRADIPSDAEPHSILVKNYQVPVNDIIIKASPRFSGNNAYIYAKTNLNTLDVPLENLSANLTRDNNFLGETNWPNLIPSKETELPFGQDTQISVTYVELPAQDGEIGIFSSKKVEQERYQFTITNNNTENVSVEIYDRIPVSTNEDIKVTLLKGTTKPTDDNVENKAGLVKWVKELKPGEVWNIKHEYQITYPEKKQIIRQNRN